MTRIAKGRSARCACFILVATAAAAAAALVASVGPAAATFRGVNGVIVFDRAPRGVVGTLQSQLFTLDPTGSALGQLTHTKATTASYSPSFSADGKRVVFVRSTHIRRRCGGGTVVGYTQEIAVMKVDGSHLHDVLQLSPCVGVLLGDPSFSPGGKTIVFDAYETLPFVRWHTEKLDQTEIFAMRADGTHIRRLTFSSFSRIRNGGGFGELEELVGNVDPSFSPDGRTIVFDHAINRKRCGGTCTVDIYALDVTSGHARRLTRNGASSRASFSPDGHQIVFTGGRDAIGQVGSSEISVMKSSGHGRRIVCSVNSPSCGCANANAPTPIGHCQRFSEAVFSPDGTRIAFLADTIAGDPKAWLISVSPDGSHPAFGGPLQLGQPPTRGFSMIGVFSYLSWQPLH